MRQVALVVMIAAVVLTALTAGCDNTPTQPSAGSPSPVGTNRIDIGGPGTVAPGQSVQFTATAHRIDGTTADITSTANWRSLRPSALTITPTGLATGGALGEANIQVTYELSAMREIVVVPAATFRLVGRVAESDNAAAGVSVARVEVVGASSGLSAMTEQDGRCDTGQPLRQSERHLLHRHQGPAQFKSGADFFLQLGASSIRASAMTKSVLLSIVVLVLGGSGCKSTPPPAPVGVLLITLDTTRADRLSPYGFMDVSMPHLERLARECCHRSAADSVAMALQQRLSALGYVGKGPTRDSPLRTKLGDPKDFVKHRTLP